MTREPYLEVTVGASADDVWRALRDPDEIARWFGWDTEGSADEIAFIFGDHATADDAARTLDAGPHRIEVAPAGAQAVVRVTRTLVEGDPDWEAFHTEIDAIDEGWRTFFQTMAFALARHAGEPRRTIFALAALEGDDPLGLAGLADAYAATVGPDALTGSVWFRSDAQVGLTVDGWGDGLLVVAEVPNGGPTMVVGSTYGLDADAVATLQERWETWFAAHGTPMAPPGA